MSIQYEKLERCYEYYRSIADFHPRVGLILGSGWEDMKEYACGKRNSIPGDP